MSSEFFDILPLEGYDPEVGLLLAAMQRNTANYRGNLGTVGRDALQWTPFLGGHSIGSVLLHLADVESYWIEQVGAGHTLTKEELAEYLSNQTKQYSVQWPAAPRQPLNYFYGLQDRVRARTLETMKGFSSTDASALVHGRQATFRWLLNHVTTHETYHYGQIMLLKLMRLRVENEKPNLSLTS